MRLVRRLCGVALHGTLLTMLLVGSGYACGMQDAGNTHMFMASMSMPDMPMSTPSDAGGNQSPADSHSDCSLPWALGGCQTMSSCSPSAMTAEAGSPVAAATPASDGVSLRAQHLRSVARSPEPPPPRA